MDLVHRLCRLDVRLILRVEACLPADWKAFKVHYRYRETVSHIVVSEAQAAIGEISITVDGFEQHDQIVHLVDDHQEHSVEVKMFTVHTATSSHNAYQTD